MQWRLLKAILKRVVVGVEEDSTGKLIVFKDCSLALNSTYTTYNNHTYTDGRGDVQILGRGSGSGRSSHERVGKYRAGVWVAIHQLHVVGGQ